MSKEFAATVFEAFTREKTSTVSGIQGTGLGMAITKSIADLIGGTIELETTPNMGTEFIIRLRLLLQSREKIETGENAGAATAEAERDYTGVKLMLPVMNGYEATKGIRWLDDPCLAAIPIMAMTANALGTVQ